LNSLFLSVCELFNLLRIYLSLEINRLSVLEVNLKRMLNPFIGSALAKLVASSIISSFLIILSVFG